MILKVGWFIAILSILAAGLSVRVATQQQIKKNDLHTTKVTAAVAFSDQNWEESKVCNEEILLENPKDKKAWFSLGLSQHYLGEYAEARNSFQQAIANGFEPGINYYNIACTYAQQENLSKTVEFARLAIDNGFQVAKFSETDPDLQKVRETPEFQQLLEDTAKR